jgi:hypothetical protein
VTIPKIIRHRKKVHITLDIAEELVNDIDQSWAFKNRAIKTMKKMFRSSAVSATERNLPIFSVENKRAKPLSPNFCLLYPY